MCTIAIVQHARELASKSDGWWESHAGEAVGTICSTLSDSNVDLNGRRVADLGCGDGIISAALASRGSHVVGFDLEPTDVESLRSIAASHGMSLDDLALEFRRAEPERLPAEDGEFDLAISWSAAEHVKNLDVFFAEAWRIVKPFGHLYVQTWPLWYSEHGHHLWTWLEPFDHLRLTRDQIMERIRGLQMIRMPVTVEGIEVDTVDEYLRLTGITRDELIELTMESYDSCNQSSLDEIQTAIFDSGFQIGRINLLTGALIVPADIELMPSHVAVSGAELLCWRRP